MSIPYLEGSLGQTCCFFELGTSTVVRQADSCPGLISCSDTNSSAVPSKADHICQQNGLHLAAWRKFKGGQGNADTVRPTRYGIYVNTSHSMSHLL